MEFPNQLKDIVYNLLQEPTLDKLEIFYTHKQVNIIPSTLKNSGLEMPL